MNKTMYELIYTRGSPSSEKFLKFLKVLISKKNNKFECTFIDLINDDSFYLEDYPTSTPKLTRIYPLPKETFHGDPKDLDQWISKNI